MRLSRKDAARKPFPPGLVRGFGVRRRGIASPAFQPIRALVTVKHDGGFAVRASLVVVVVVD